MLNRMQIIGRLTRDPETRVLATGTKVTDFALASNEVFYKNQEKQEKTTFTEWSVWNGSGENLAKIAGKGDLIYAEGPFSLDQWSDQDGNPRSKARFTALAWKLLSKAGGAGAPKKAEDAQMGEEAAKPVKRGRKPKTEHAAPNPAEDDVEDDTDTIPF